MARSKPDARDRLTAALARLTVGVFYRSVDVVDARRVPERGPLLLVANHPNSLVDPLVLMASLGRVPRFLGKSTLWDIPPLRPLLRLARVIPVYRRQDAGADVSLNERTFARCREELAGGSAVALFPEGISYHEPRMQPLRSGAARIAVGAEAAFGPLGLSIVPIGLTFEDKGRFRSRALVQVGEAIAAADYAGPRGVEDRAAVDRLTLALESGLRAVTLNADSWRQAELVQHASDVFAQAGGELPLRASLAERVPLRRRFIDAYRELSQRSPERLDALLARLREYAALLEASGLEDRHVRARYRGVPGWTGTRLAELLCMAPAALLGALINALPYLVTRWIGSRYRRHPELPASFKLLSGAVLFPLAWLAAALVCGRLWGPVAGWAAAAAGPLCGYVGVLFRERQRSLRREARALLVLRRDPARGERLRRLRGSLRREFARLAREHWPDERPEAGLN
ncbi:MAG: 1-acyl-sn-glycerol-3-phosphate acyltransferase [Proteobacteria bacterium]|nr:1-acyl-sn-glycerol-3-phosphate acyltransferase [Pseudomonadota bacterium]